MTTPPARGAAHGPSDRQSAAQLPSGQAHRAGAARLPPCGRRGRSLARSDPVPGQQPAESRPAHPIDVPGAPAGAPQHRRESHCLPRHLIAPPSGYAKQQPTQLARYDVVVLIETTSPEVTGEVQTVDPYKLLVAAVQDAARDVHMMAARCVKRVADVDKTRQGLFLFNYFVADDAAVALQLWDYLAGWYAVETGLRNSTVLEPLGDADYVFVNHARWDHSVPRFMLRQLTKPSFRRYLLANLQANRTGAMPILYRLA